MTTTITAQKMNRIRNKRKPDDNKKVEKDELNEIC